MLQIIPINNRNNSTNDSERIKYIENIENDSMAKKCNRVIDNIILNQSEEIICFRHADTILNTPLDVIEYKLNKLFKSHEVGIAGVIGTIALDINATWWNGVLRAGGRETYGAGAIIQGGKNDKGEPIEYFMAGDLHSKNFSTNTYLATIDGCCMFFPKWIFEEGLRFDETLLNYHFYDADISLQVLERGYKVSTVDISVKHDSTGIPPSNFDELRKIFIEKWSKKVHNEWPISRLSTFYKD